MAKEKYKKNEATEYFRTVLKRWFDESEMKLIDAAELLGVSHTYLSRLLRVEPSIALPRAEEIAHKLKKDLPEMLMEGRELLGKKPKFSPPKKLSNIDEAIEAFKFCLLSGGEAADMLAQNAIELAKKKKAEADLQNPTTAKLSKSA